MEISVHPQPVHSASSPTVQTHSRAPISFSYIMCIIRKCLAFLYINSIHVCQLSLRESQLLILKHTMYLMEKTCIAHQLKMKSKPHQFYTSITKLCTSHFMYIGNNVRASINL